MKVVREKRLIIVTNGVRSFVAPKRQWKKEKDAHNHQISPE